MSVLDRCGTLDLSAIVRACAWCSLPFLSARRRGKRGRPAKHCSDQCRRSFQVASARRRRKKRRGVLTCACGCGSTWEAEGRRSKYLNAGHRNKHVREMARDKWRSTYVPSEHPSRACERCGETYSAWVPFQRYCSHSCERKVSNHRRGSGHMHRARRYGVEWERVNPTLVFERDGWRCQLCGKHTPKARRGTHYANAPELDHRVPMSCGGSHTYSNTQTACRACNARKGNRSSVGQIPLWSAPPTVPPGGSESSQYSPVKRGVPFAHTSPGFEMGGDPPFGGANG